MSKKLFCISLLLASTFTVSAASAELLTAECSCEETRNGNIVLNDQTVEWEIDTEANTVSGHFAEITKDQIFWAVTAERSTQCVRTREYLLNRHPTGYPVRKPCKRGHCTADKILKVPELFAAIRCEREDCSKYRFYGLTSAEVYTCGEIDEATQQHCRCEMRPRAQ